MRILTFFLLTIFVIKAKISHGQTIGKFKIFSAGIAVERPNKSDLAYSLTTTPGSYLLIARDTIRIILDVETKLIPIEFKPIRYNGDKTITEIACVDMERDRCNFGLIWNNKDKDDVGVILKFSTHTLILTLVPLTN